MAEIKVSQLPEATDTKSNDTFLVVQDGLTKKILFENILNNLKSAMEIVVRLSTNKFKVVAGLVNSITVTNTGKVAINTLSGDPNVNSNVHISGNIKIGSLESDVESDNGIFIHASEVLTNASGSVSVPISTAKKYTQISVTGIDERTYTLSAGLPGQEKTIICTQKGTGAVKIIWSGPQFYSPVASYTFGLGAILNVYCTEEGKWIIMSSNGVTA